MKLLPFLLALAVGLAPLLADAHAPKVGPHGGPQTDAGRFHVELMPDGTALAVYLRNDSDQAVMTEGYKGTAIFVIDGKPERIALTPAGENRLTGTASKPLPAEPKGAVQITAPDGSSAQAKY